MAQWLDSLSEEWISQPRSSTPASLKEGSSQIEYSSNLSQSRIPRLKARSTSYPSIQGEKSLDQRSSRTPSKTGSPLVEKTASALNTSGKQNPKQRTNRDEQNLKASPAKLARRHTSNSSLSPIQQSTVQCKIPRKAPTTNDSPRATPDWKRRVLEGVGKPGEQRDLFSPMGLEHIFKLPSIHKDPQQRKGRKYEPQASAIFPSSPPPYPRVSQAIPSVPQTASTTVSYKENVDASKVTVIKSTLESKNQAGINISNSPECYSDKLPTSSPLKRQLNRLHGKPSISLRVDRSNHPLTPVPGINSEDGKNMSSQVRKSSDFGRIISSSSELHNEAISPVSLLQLSSIDAIGPRIRPSSRSSDNGIDYRNTGPSRHRKPTTVATADYTTHSLPDDLSMGTEAFISNGGFVNLHRGGCLSDDSFQRRSLSPSSFPCLDAILQDSSLAYAVPKPDAQQLMPSGSRSRSQSSPSPGSVIAPETPSKAKQECFSGLRQPRSSGSPLKLFDKYDTFTNDRLVHRLSQFEESFQEDRDDIPSESSEIGPPAAMDVQSGVPEHFKSTSRRNSKTRNRKVSRFGDGGLDGYGFTHEAPGVGYRHYKNNGNSETQGNHPSPPKQHLDEHTRYQRGSESSSRLLKQTRKVSTSTKSNRLIDAANSKWVGGLLDNGTQHEKPLLLKNKDDHPGEIAEYDMAGKRLLNSPAKISQPKRRRTTHATENPEATSSVNVDGVPKALPIIGRKRKDARYEVNHQVADPRILATRHILRPRTPTPSQIRLSDQAASKSNNIVPNKGLLEDSNGSGSNRIVKTGILPTADTPTHVLAEELATFAIDVAQDIATGSRKASVTTADFFNEANLIMQHIRAKGSAQTIRISGEVSEPEQLEDIEESINEGSTQDRFSRPPSREGCSLRRLREPKPLDPRVVSHLRKYQDDEDLGIALSSSLGVLEPLGNSSYVTFNGVESDPPNMRIRSHRGSNNQEEEAASEPPTKISSRYSYQSSRTSTERSNPTGSSSGSGNKAIIAPAKISHLISDHVAGMTFDHTKQVWVKRKSSSNNSKGGPDAIDSDFTEDNPLGEIPDLIVDEIEELERIKTSAFVSRTSSSRDSTESRAEAKVPASDQPSPAHMDHVEITSITSNVVQGAVDKHSSVGDNEHDEEVEHETSILEGRSTKTPERLQKKNRQARVVTVSFSSPLINHFQEPSSRSGIIDSWEEESVLDLAHTPQRPESQRRQASASASYNQTPLASFRRGGRRVSLSSHVYMSRPISRIEEEDELSFLQSPKNNESNMDLVLTTPLPFSELPGALSMPPSTGRRSGVTFHLSSLSDFTLNQIDDLADRDSSYVTKRRGLLSIEDAEGRFSLAIKDLVRTITDVEPYEPYWEYIRKLDLRRKGLLTLHLLDDFCGRIQELNVSDNELSHLNGAPSSIRILSVRGNCLSNLTTWSHLQNLQYLDVSANHIQNLQGFQGLWHLRELRADDNQIESLDGIHGMSGLIKLRLRRNVIKSVDFEGADL